jgi:threonine dehydratase
MAARDALRLRTAIVGVVSAGADAYFQSFRARRPVETARATTMADGMAVRVPVADALAQILAGAEDVVTVTDDDVAEAMRIYFDDTHQVAEGAGAAPLAALLKAAPRGARREAVILCGGNVDRPLYQRILAGGSA